MKFLYFCRFCQVEVFLPTTRTKHNTTCSEVESKHNEPWQPLSHHGRHNASPPALRRKRISQQTMQQQQNGLHWRTFLRQSEKVLVPHIQEKRSKKHVTN